jgi:hypothetical protein
LPRKVTISKPVPKGKDKAAVPTKSTAFQPVLKTHTTIKKLPVSTKPKIITVQKSEEIGTKLSTSPVPVGDIKEDISVVSASQQHSSSGKDNSSDSSLYVSALEDM